VDTTLAYVSDLIPLLQAYAHQYHDTGQESTSSWPVQTGTVVVALQGIAQTFLGLGSPNLPLDHHSTIDYCLHCQMASYGKDDPTPPCQAHLYSILQHIAFVAQASQDAQHATIADILITIAFYFLLQPREYTGSSHGAHPFCLEDVLLFRQG